MTGSKHCVLFNGEIFDQKDEYKMLKSYFLGQLFYSSFSLFLCFSSDQSFNFPDFYRGETMASVNLTGLDHVISVSASQEGKIYFRVYMVRLKKSGTRLPRVELEEMGPSVDFELRRFQAASKEVMHEALKVPRTLKPKKVKNVSTDLLGKKYGRVHMQKQDFNKMALKKMKGLKRSRADRDGGNDENAAGGEPTGKRTRVEPDDE